jgi:hypothetical protein
VAKRELKALYDIGQCDVYLNLRKKETADRLKRCVLNYFAKNTLNVRTTYDMLLELIPVFASLFNTLKLKNDIYIKSVVEQLQRYPI